MGKFELKLKFDGVKIIDSKEINDFQAVKQLLKDVERKFK
jgi:hypothetical protein